MDCYEAFREIVADFKHLMETRESDIRKYETRLSENLRDETNVVRRLEQQVEVIRLELSRLRADSSSSLCTKCSQPLDVHEQYSQEVRRHLLHKEPEATCYQMAAPAPTAGILKNSSESPQQRRHHQWYGSPSPMPGQNVSSDYFGGPLPPPMPSFHLDYPSHTSTSTTRSGSRTPIAGMAPEPTARLNSFDWNSRKTHKLGRNNMKERNDQSYQKLWANVNCIQEDIEDRMRELNDKVDRVTSKTYRMLNRTSHLNSTSQALKDQILTLQHDLTNINTNLR